MNVESLLKSAYPAELVNALLSAYKEIESNYAVKKWKASELDAGHFVEACRRIVEKVLFNTYTPIGKSMPNFNDAELKKYENAAGDESYRILIPRVLKSVYNLRNKRGVGHLGQVSPNEMDATLILYSVKWVLGDLIRLSSGGQQDVTAAQRAVDAILERRLDLIWKSGDVVRILDSGIAAREQILILLYESNLLTEDSLRTSIEYKNAANFRKIIKRLHDDRFLEYFFGKPIIITSKGVIEAEKIIISFSGSETSGTAQKPRRRKRK